MMYKVLLAVLAIQQIVVAPTTADSDGGNNENECVSQQEMADMKGRVEKLETQLNYWQNVTINILKELYFSSHSGTRGECEVSNTLELSLLNNITEKSMETNEQLKKLKNSVDQLQQSQENNTQKLCVITETNKETSRQLEGLQDSMEQLQGTIEQLKDCCNDTVSVGTFHNPGRNCTHIAQREPNAVSGYYWLQSDPGYAVKVYCDMERVCGCDEGRGGWMRVADINMTRQMENCPTGFREVTSSDKKMCGGRDRSCVGTNFSSNGFEYSRVCGRIIGYQFGETDAFETYHVHQRSIEDNFFDGIVLTHGRPRCHIWSFAAGHNQYTSGIQGCPCNSGSYSGTIPPYVQNDYFCDSGVHYSTTPSHIYYVNDPLWDGTGCVRGSCCQFNSPPWFCKDLPHPTSEDIELRLCYSYDTSIEDVLFEVVEIYVQ